MACRRACAHGAALLGLGPGKIVGLPGFAQFATAHGVPLALPLGWTVIVFELAGAACIALGWRVRAASILFVIYILVLGPWFHPFWRFNWHQNPMLAQMMLDDFFHHLTMAGGFIVLAIHGPGRIRIGL